MRRVWSLGLFLIAGCWSAVAVAAMLYTAPLDVARGSQAACEAVNVSGGSVTITVALIDGDDGTEVATYTAVTGPTQPGISVTYIVPVTGSTFYFCVITTSTASKTTVRGHGASFNPATGIPGPVEDAS